ncbi:MAG: CDP-alcohol phosphatidyltransferase family protein [Lentisphaeria bacterium]|nr:CDP-alcohol phosphatidyltransferase family protein [Lentisphaeria bacterium]
MQDAPAENTDSTGPSKRTRFVFVLFLTFLRVPLVFVFLIMALIHSQNPRPLYFWIAFLSVIISSTTDLLDGYYARKLRVVSALGAYADPLTDKIVYLTALPLLVFLTAAKGDTPHAIFLLIFTILFLLRDQWVSFLRSIGSMYNVSAKANWSGKLRTAINFPLICIIYFCYAYPKVLPGPVLTTLEVLGLVINLVSMYVYTKHYWPSLLQSMDYDKSDQS